MKQSSLPPRAGRNPRSACRRTIGALALALAPLALASCAVRDQPVSAEARAGEMAISGAALSVSAAELLEYPKKYASQTVTVTGEVNDVFAPGAFAIGGDEFHSPGRLLVATRSGSPAIPNRPGRTTLAEDDIVQVTGRVHVILGRKLEPSVLDFAFGDDPWLVEWEGKPVLVASSIVTIPRAALPPLSNVTTIITHPYPLQFVGRHVKLDRTRVLQVVNPRTYWVGSGPMFEILVRLPDGAGSPPDLKRGQIVSVDATFRKAPPIEAAVREWGLDGVSEATLEKQGFYLDAEPTQVVSE